MSQNTVEEEGVNIGEEQIGGEVSHGILDSIESEEGDDDDDKAE